MSEEKVKICPSCLGDGEIEVDVEYDHNENPITEWVKCRPCKGTGRITIRKLMEER